MDFIFAMGWMILLALFWIFAIVGTLLATWIYLKRKRRGGEKRNEAAGRGESRRSGGDRSGAAPQRIDSHNRQRYDAAVARALDKVGRQTRTQPSTHEEKHPAHRQIQAEETRRRRLVEAESKERARSALRALSSRGYYVFDEIVTDSAGIADHLAVGPWGVCVVLVLDHPDGRVERDTETNQFIFRRRLFPEDPDERGAALVYDIVPRIFGESGPIAYYVCFTSAGTEKGERDDYPEGSCSVWNLSEELCPAREPEMSPEEVALAAQRVRAAYSRQPYVRPTETEED